MEPVYPETLNEERRAVRTSARKLWNDEAHSKAAKISFSRDIAKLWNSVPDSIKNVLKLNSAKNEIKKHCKTIET